MKTHHRLYPDLIHVGYPKTATKWLQQTVFTRDNTPFYSPWNWRQTSRALTWKCPTRFSRDDAYKFFEDGLKEAREKKLVSVISHETITDEPRYASWKSYYLIERIYCLFPQTKIFIVIREQKKNILSWYKHEIRYGAHHSIRRYLEQTEPPLHPLCDLRFFEYHAILRRYFDVFGEPNVLVLPYEMLVLNPKRFMDRLMQFTEVQWQDYPIREKRNVGLGPLAVIFRRALNWFLRPAQERVDKGNLDQMIMRLTYRVNRLSPKSANSLFYRRWERLIAEQIGDYFKYSNRETKRITGLDLKKYGYDL